MGSYRDILADMALRIGEVGSIVGSSTADIEANYSNAGFGASQIDNPAFPFSAQKNALLMAEGQLAGIVAAQKRHPLRAVLRGVTASLANRTTLPTVDVISDKIIGVWGSVRDATDNKICERVEDPQELERIIRLQSLLKAPVYKYGIDGATIIHTRPAVVAEVCKYNYATQAALIASNGNIFFPDTMRETLVCGGIKFCFRYDEAPDTVKNYINFFNEACANIASGGMPQK